MIDLGITRSELVQNMGYSNTAKGCRRIDQLCAGDVGLVKNLRLMLAQGLAVNVEIIDQVIAFTRTEQVAAEDAAYRKVFQPHAIILTERSVPSPIFVYAMAGGSKLLIINFQEDSSPQTYAEQAREALPQSVPAFGNTTGYVVNYRPDYAVQFDKEGKSVAEFDRAHRVGEASVIIGGKKIDEETWSALLGEVREVSAEDLNKSDSDTLHKGDKIRHEKR